MNAVTEENMPLILAHERFVRGQMGGCRAHFRLEQLPGLILRKRTLDGIEFIGCDLPKSQLLMSSMKGASFYCSNLRGSDLRATDLTRADMRGAVLRGADLYRANLDGADFRKAVLLKSERDKEFETLSHYYIDDDGFEDGSVDFRDCMMTAARLNKAKLKGADFSGAVMTGSDLRHADLRGSNFDGAVLTDVQMEGTLLEGASMGNVLRDPEPTAIERAGQLLNQIHASHVYTQSGGKSGRRAVLDGEDLRPLDDALSGKGLVGATFRNACGVRVKFIDAILVGAVFDGADLRGARFDGADLRGCSFRNCNLKHAIFDDSNLTSFSGSSGRLFTPHFEGASLGSARFIGAAFDPDSELAEFLGRAQLAEAA